MASIRLPQRRAGRLLAVLAALAGTTALTAAPAAADAGSGTATLNFAKQNNATSLSAQGVKVSYRDGKAGASKAPQRGNGHAGQTVALNVVDVTLGSAPKARVSGTLQLKLGKRQVALRAIELRGNGKQTVLRGKVGNKTIVAFSAKGGAKVDGLSVKQGPARLSLTSQGADAFAEKLGLDKIAAGKLGTFLLNASQDAKPVTPSPAPVPAPPPPKSEDEVPTPPDPYPYAVQCPVKEVDGPGFGQSPVEIAGIAPAPVFGATSQPVTGTAVEWGFLVDFRGYVLGGGKTAGSFLALDGASNSADGSGMAAPNAFFSFPVGTGTYERGAQANHSDDKLVADGTGTVLMCKSAHGFNVVLKNPTVTIDGAQSRLTADVGANLHGTWYPFQRADIATLDLSSVEPAVTDGGNTVAWENVPVTMSEDGANVTGLGDQYPAGTVLDTITIETTLDRPLLAQCGVDAGVATPPSVDFSLEPLPTLNAPVITQTAQPGKNIGTINWGFRRATRGTVGAPGGLFLPLDGASEGFPGSMAGGPSLPPAGGVGKFFRFPISSYSYSAGTASATDDQLIATSNAAVGLCKPKTTSGNYAVVLAKPTLIIAGGESRLVANAYSFAGPFMGGPAEGWAGGRVDLVDLDMTGIEATTGVGTVRWGEVNPDWEPLQNGISIEGGFLTNALTIASGLGEGEGEGGFDKVAAQIVLP